MEILVVGDVMLDWDNIAKVSRISPEAPVLVADVQEEYFRLGGAANVSNNLHDIGCNVSICGVIGEDYFGEVLEQKIGEKNIDFCLLKEKNKRTIVKQRFLSNNNIHLFRGDREDRGVISEENRENVLNYIQHKIKHGIDAIVIADYAKGFIGEYLSDFLNSVDIPIFADLKPNNIHMFNNLIAITPNKKEAFEYFKMENAHIQNDNQCSLKQMAELLNEKSQNVIITLGENGVYLMNDEYDGVFINTIVNTNGYNVVDTCGCGDVITAIFAYAYLDDGPSIYNAIQIANIAAGITVKDVGVSSISDMDYNAIKDDILRN
jgi:rfaE bifunctional protein kinase chain/domain